MSNKISEKDLYNPIRNWLEKSGWTVYGEVTGQRTTKRADLVAEHTGKYLVVEMKTSLSNKLIEQAIYWTNYANYVFIAIPKRTQEIPFFIKEILHKYKIGIIEVDLKKFEFSNYDDEESELITMQMTDNLLGSSDLNGWKKLNTDVSWLNINRKYYLRGKTGYFDKLVHPEMRETVGGVDDGGYITPYKLTIKSIENYLQLEYLKDVSSGLSERNAGYRTVSDIVDNVETHYSQPKPSVSKALLEFETSKFEVLKSGNRNYFRLKKPSLKATGKIYKINIYIDNNGRLLMNTSLPLDRFLFDVSDITITPMEHWYYIKTIPKKMYYKQGETLEELEFTTEVRREDVSESLFNLGKKYKLLVNGKYIEYCYKDFKTYGDYFSNTNTLSRTYKLDKNIVEQLLQAQVQEGASPVIDIKTHPNTYKLLSMKRKYSYFNNLSEIINCLDTVVEEMQRNKK